MHMILRTLVQLRPAAAAVAAAVAAATCSVRSVDSSGISLAKASAWLTKQTHQEGSTYCVLLSYS